jgi:hypothetical protein
MEWWFAAWVTLPSKVALYLTATLALSSSLTTAGGGWLMAAAALASASTSLLALQSKWERRVPSDSLASPTLAMDW